MSRVVIIVIAIVACGAPAPVPVPTSSPPIGTADCQRWATAMRDSCAFEPSAGMELCMRLTRLSEAASCIQQVKRSYECGSKRYAACTNDDACCRNLPDPCEDVDTALDNCVRGYCGGHLSNPDCVTTFPDLGSGAASPP